jgi:DNA-binding CsgD family transcriptional regulator
MWRTNQVVVDKKMFQDDLNDRVVQNLYEAAAGLVPWSDALNGLHREMQVRQMQLLTIDKHDGTLVRSDQPSCMEPLVFDAILEYVREYHQHDPHVQFTGALPVGVVANTADNFPREEYDNHPFYREYWAAFGVRELLSAKIAEDDRYVVMLGMSRTQDLAPFESAHVRKLERYVAHLASAYRIVRHLGSVQATAQAGLALMETATRPMILLDRNQSIISNNGAAQRVLELGSVIYRNGTYLACRSKNDSLELRRALTSVGMTDVQGVSAPRPRRMALRFEGSEGGRETMLCSLWAMQPASTMSAFGPTSVGLLTVAECDSNDSADPVFLASMFDLTPSEAKLAVALLKGSDLKTIAAIHRISLETVRVQLKSLFTKTDTHRQSELIALLMRATGV